MNESPQAPEPSRIPIRGIAMILLAVAVLLLAWGVYSMTNSSGDNVVTKPKSVQTQQATGTPAPANQAPVNPAQTGQAPVTPAPATPATSNQAQASANPAVPAAGNDVDPTAVKIHALNNSTVQGLANRVADTLKKQGFSQVESGNFPNEVLPNSVVFYTPGNAAEQKAAEAIAYNLGIKAQPRNDSVKDTPAGVVLVITEELNR
ncbi:LytR C-terminal domain-containing protein [Corynebacterium epidermidicanis]|nr:LytR C-terminal domain-containing protein [Corynebacterium epidermidicanis]